MAGHRNVTLMPVLVKKRNSFLLLTRQAGAEAFKYRAGAFEGLAGYGSSVVQKVEVSVLCIQCDVCRVLSKAFVSVHAVICFDAFVN
jgi:hypothetical protein